MTDYVLNTISVVARCEASGRLGAIVTSGRPFVGALIPLVNNDVVIASQALASPVLAKQIAARVDSGQPLVDACSAALAEDQGSALRQVAAMDKYGNQFAFTGSENIPWAGHLEGNDFVAAGNMLTGREALEAAEEGYRNTRDEDFPVRLLRALENIPDQSGDVRGKISASLRVSTATQVGYINLRADDTPDPISELRRLLTLWYATQGAYESIMPTDLNPTGEIDPDKVRSVRAKLNVRPESE